MRVENESDSSWGKSEFENGNESSHMSDAKKYANFSGFRYSPTICCVRVYGEGKTHPGKVYHLVEVYLPLDIFRTTGIFAKKPNRMQLHSGSI